MLTEYQFTQDKNLIKVNEVYQFLAHQSDWAKNIPKEDVEISMKNSLCFAILHQNRLVAFARVITDKSTFAYLCDVFVLPAYRGKSLSNWLMKEIVAHPDLQKIRRFLLKTSNPQAKKIYGNWGFKASTTQDTFMDIYKPYSLIDAACEQDSHT